MLEHALRIVRGDAVFVAPSIEFAPYPYPPLFHYFGAAATSLFGEGLPALRAVSLLGCALAALALFVSGFGWGGVGGVGLLFSAFGWTGVWVDIGRVDSLAMGLIALAIACAIRAARSSRGALASGVLAALAAMTKQTCLPVGAALALALLLRRPTRRAGVLLLSGWLAVLAPFSLWLEAATDGWFSFTVIDLLRGSPWHGPAITGFWVESIPVLALVLALGGLLAQGRSPGAKARPESLVVAFAFVSLLAAAWAGRAHEGGFDNTLWPMALGAAFASAFLLRGVLASGRAGRTVWAAALTAACTLLLFQDPRDAVPTDADRTAYQAACAAVGTIEGRVWQPISPLPSVAPGGVHRMAIVDLLKSRETAAATTFAAELAEALRQREFAAIVLDAPPRETWGDLGHLIDANYRFERTLGPPTGIGESREPLAPVTGAELAPRQLFVPR